MARRTSWGSRGSGHGASGDAERPLSARERVSQRLQPPSSRNDIDRFERAVDGLGDVAARRNDDAVSDMLSELREQIQELTGNRSPRNATPSPDLADDIRGLIRELEDRDDRHRPDLADDRARAVEALQQFKSQIAALSDHRRPGRRSQPNLPGLYDLERAVSRIAKRQDEIERHSHSRREENETETESRLERLGRRLDELRGRPGDGERGDLTERDVRGLRGQISELKDQIDRLGSTYPDLVEAMEDGLEEIARRFSRLDETPDTLIAMERSYRDVAEQLTKLADQSEHVGEIRAKLADIRRKLDAAPSADSVRSLEERILDLARRLDTLGNRSERRGDERLAQIEEQLSEIARALAPLKASSASSLEAGLAAIANFVAEPERREPDVLRALDDQIDRLAEGIAASLKSQKAESVVSIERRLDALAEQIDASALSSGTDLAPLEDRLHGITEQIGRLGSSSGDGGSIETLGNLVARFEAALDNLAGRTSDPAFDERIDRLAETAEMLAGRAEGADLAPVLEEIAAVRQAVAAPATPPDDDFRALLMGVSEQLERLSGVESVTPTLLDEQVVRILEALDRKGSGSETADRMERALQTIEARLAGAPIEAPGGRDAAHPQALDLGAFEELVASLRNDLAALRDVTEVSSRETRETLEEMRKALHVAAAPTAAPPPMADAPPMSKSENAPREAASAPNGARPVSPAATGAPATAGSQPRRSTASPAVAEQREPPAPAAEGKPAPAPALDDEGPQRRPAKQAMMRPENPSEAPRKGTSAEALRRFATLQAKGGASDEPAEAVETERSVKPRDDRQSETAGAGRTRPAMANPRRGSEMEPGSEDATAVSSRPDDTAAPIAQPRTVPPVEDHSGVSLDQPTDTQEEGVRRGGFLSRLRGKGDASKKAAPVERPATAERARPSARTQAGGDVPADRVDRAMSRTPTTGASQNAPPASGGLLETDDPAVQNMLRQMRAAKTPSQSTFLANARRAAQAASVQAMEAERIEKETKHPSPIVRAVGKLRSKKVILLALFLGGAGGMLAVPADEPTSTLRNLAGLIMDGTGLAGDASRQDETGPRFGDRRVSLLVAVAAAPSAPPHPSPDLFSPEPDGSGMLNASSRVAAAQTLTLLELPIALGPPELRDAARAGNPAAQFEVGARLASNLYTTRNLPAAIAWYTKAAAAGYPDALYRLGAMYENGVGVQEDRTRALELYLGAAERGHRVAMHNLGVMLAGGAGGGRPDMKESLRWFREAARRGVRDSQFNLGLVYARGLGVKKDPVEAYKWFAIAARADDEAAAGRRDAIAAKLRSSQLAEARQAVAAFTPLPFEEASAEEGGVTDWLGAQREYRVPDLSAWSPVSLERSKGRKS